MFTDVNEALAGRRNVQLNFKLILKGPGVAPKALEGP